MELVWVLVVSGRVVYRVVGFKGEEVFGYDVGGFVKKREERYEGLGWRGFGFVWGFCFSRVFSE